MSQKEEKVKEHKVKEHKEKSGSFLESKPFKKFMVKLYGLGASVVIIGALFKIQHWKGAGFALTLGLTTEALIFAVSAFDPQKGDVDWTRVYPELKGEEPPETARSITSEVARMLEQARVDQETVNRMGEGFNKFSDTMSGLKQISNAVLATDKFTEKINIVTENVERVNESYKRSAEALSVLSEQSGSTKDYFNQMKSASVHLATLNNVYEMEINNTNKYNEAISKYQTDRKSVV